MSSYPEDNPEVMTQNKERQTILRDCLRQLSSAHREIIDLVYYHGQSVRDIARTIGVSPATLKTRMFYARKHLAKLTAAYAGAL